MVEEDRGGEVETQAAEGRKAGDTINERREPGQRECRASDIFSSIVALIVGISWPVTLIILIILFYEHLPSLRTLTSGLRQVFPDRTISKVEAGLGPNRMRKKSIDRRFAAIHRLGHVRKPLI